MWIGDMDMLDLRVHEHCESETQLGVYLNMIEPSLLDTENCFIVEHKMSGTHKFVFFGL